MTLKTLPLIFELKQDAIDVMRLVRNVISISNKQYLALSREVSICTATGHSFHIFNLNDNIFIRVSDGVVRGSFNRARRIYASRKCLTEYQYEQRLD